MHSHTADAHLHVTVVSLVGLLGTVSLLLLGTLTYLDADAAELMSQPVAGCKETDPNSVVAAAVA